MKEIKELNEEAVLEILKSYGDDPQQIIAVLLDIQAASGRHYVDKRWAKLVSERLNVPLTKVFDVLSFYAMFSTEPRGVRLIEICESVPCRFGRPGLRAKKLERWLENAAGIKINGTSADGKLSLSRTSCVGACDIGPAVKIGDEVFGNLTEEKIKELVRRCLESDEVK